MSELLKFLFEQITDPLTLPINPVAEWIVLLFVHKLVYTMAYDLVGDMYSVGFISGRTAGKVMHWTLRTICFFFVWATVSGVIIVGQFVVKYWVAIAIGILALVGVWIACEIAGRKTYPTE